jgi:hypothetical protein
MTAPKKWFSSFRTTLIIPSTNDPLHKVTASKVSSLCRRTKEVVWIPQNWEQQLKRRWVRQSTFYGGSHGWWDYFNHYFNYW